MTVVAENVLMSDTGEATSLVDSPTSSRDVPSNSLSGSVLPDPCTRIDRIVQSRLGSRIELSISTRRDFGAVCDAEATPFERHVALSIVMLEVGLYSVVANGVDAPFSVNVDPFDL